MTSRSTSGRDFVLTVRRDGKLLAQWSLDQGPLEMTVIDGRTGETASTFMATPPVGTDEIQHFDEGRQDGDDITLPLPEPTASLQRVERHSETSEPTLFDPAEVWIQNHGEWRSAGELHAKQRVTTLGGWIRNTKSGRLVVSPGPRLAGSATLPDGRTVEIAASSQAVSLPPGASVLLGDGHHGIYVRSEPMVPDPRPAPRFSLQEPRPDKPI
jgi:hypothetical protein